MKILYLWHYKKTNNYDHYLNVDFANFIKHYPGIELMGYGLDFEKGYPDLAPIAYNPNITLEDIYKEFLFDIIIANTKGRAFEYYNPHTSTDKGTWFPKDFSVWTKTKKLVIEEDYHYEADDLWYKEMKFDLILQRHYSQSLRQNRVPMRFFPFSVDISVFNSYKTEVPHINKIIYLPTQNQRIRKIAFVGHNADKTYTCRFEAIKELVKHGLGVNFSTAEVGNRRKIDGEYIEVLRQYIGYISCGSTYEICAAKNLEIIASGGILFTNKFKGLELLLPEDSYVLYKEDMSDIVEKARKVINEPDYCAEIVKNGRETILEMHSHEQRVKELLHIIEKEL